MRHRLVEVELLAVEALGGSGQRVQLLPVQRRRPTLVLLLGVRRRAAVRSEELHCVQAPAHL